MTLYPLPFRPIYKEKIWGGRNLERLFGRDLPEGRDIGESWDLADLPEGVSEVACGPLEDRTLTELTREIGAELLGGARPSGGERFPLLLKLLDANETLSLQVHPDEQAVREIPGADLKTECWYVLESRDGYIYKGVKEGVTPERFREAIENDTVEDLVQRYDVAAGDFHYLPAGTVHALGKGVVVAEVQTPSDTTYRVTDWGRGREIHVERSMQCIHFEPAAETPPGADGDVLLRTDYFTVVRRRLSGGQSAQLPAGRCSALMVLEASGTLQIHGGAGANPVSLRPGQTVLLPAGLEAPSLQAGKDALCLEVLLPE